MNVDRKRIKSSTRRRESLMTGGFWDTEEHGQGFCHHLFQAQPVERSRKLESFTDIPSKRSTGCA
jgi:hypothetical protein